MGSGRNKIQDRINYVNREEYKAFIQKYPNSNITYDIFIKTLKASTTAIRNSVLDNPLGFKLPYNLGYIAVDKFKEKLRYKVIDWYNSKRLKKEVPLTNFHSFGYMYKIKLYPNLAVVPMRNFEMKAHRVFNRLLAKNIKQNLRQYISIDRSYYSQRFNIDKLITQTNED